MHIRQLFLRVKFDVQLMAHLTNTKWAWFWWVFNNFYIPGYTQIHIWLTFKAIKSHKCAKFSQSLIRSVFTVTMRSFGQCHEVAMDCHWHSLAVACFCQVSQISGKGPDKRFQKQAFYIHEGWLRSYYSQKLSDPRQCLLLILSYIPNIPTWRAVAFY